MLRIILLNIYFSIKHSYILWNACVEAQLVDQSKTHEIELGLKALLQKGGNGMEVLVLGYSMGKQRRKIKEKRGPRKGSAMIVILADLTEPERPPPLMRESLSGTDRPQH